ncbi:MAG TPA: glycosyltransferase family 39 protein [Vicinamibacterales bacterium]|nr:glycosyltransferase family 39 protein [Vicinamibacterales bacterium]
MKAWHWAVAVGALALLLYVPGLSSSPPYLHHDEVFFANQAYEVARTGRDTAGHFLPVFFEVYPGWWYQPILVYFSALFLKVLPFSEATIRLPSVAIGIIDVVLVYFVARRLFRDTHWAAFAAVGLALTPAHFLQARLAVDSIYLLPFVLIWLLCVVSFLDGGGTSWLAGAGVALGAGLFSYVAAWVLAPVYLALTCIVLAGASDKPAKSIAALCSGFALPVAAAVPFLVRHPEMLASKWSLYGAAGASNLGPVQRLGEFLTYGNLTDRVGLYFEFFNPSYLFMSGGTHIVSSTREVGVFLLPLAIFVPVGIYTLLHDDRSAAAVLVLAGFATAPVAALLVNEHGVIERELVVLPFGALLATFGVRRLWSASLTTRLPLVRWIALAIAMFGLSYAAWRLATTGHLSRMTVPLIVCAALLYLVAYLSERTESWRVITLGLLFACAVQFAGFYRDYFGDYRRRASGWFEFNHRGGMEAIITREPRERPAPVLVSKNMQFAEVFWRLYCSKAGREDLYPLMMFFDPASTSPPAMPPGTFVLVLTAEANDRVAFPARSALTLVEEVPEVGGHPVYSVLVMPPHSS